MSSWGFDSLRPEQWSRRWMDLLSSSSAAVASGRLPAIGMGSWDPFSTLLDSVLGQLVGKRRTYRVQDRDVTMVLDELTTAGSDLQRSVGQYGEVRIRVRDIETGSHRIDWCQIRAGNVHLRPAGLLPTVVAAPVYWEAFVATSEVAAWLHRVAPDLDVSFDGPAPTVGLAHRAPWARLEFEPIADGKVIRLAARALHLGSRRINVRLPSRTITLTALGPEDWVTAVAITTEGAHIEGLRTEWQRSLSRADLDQFVASVRDGVGRLIL